MEVQIFMITTTMLSIFFSIMLFVSPSASLHIHHFQPSLEHQVNGYKLKIYLPTLPRKLIFTDQVKEHEGRDFVGQKDVKENLLAGKQEHNRRNQKMVIGRKETRREEIREDIHESDDIDPSQYFTMDYSRVRRRRPVHNKHIPLPP